MYHERWDDTMAGTRDTKPISTHYKESLHCGEQYHQFSSVTHSCLTLGDPWAAACRSPCPSPTPGVYPNSCPLSQWCHLIPCRPLLLLPSIFPSIRVFSNESALYIRWSKYWSFSFSISPSNEHPGLISLRWTGWISLQSKGLSRVSSNTTVQNHQFFGAQFLYSPTLTSIHDYWKDHSFE